MIHTRTQRAGIACAGVAALALIFASPVSAHVEPSPIAVQAGTSSTISFGVEHGCDDSGVVKVEIQVPDGVSAVTPVEGPDGWTGTFADGVVTFVGGPQPSHEALELSINATFPNTPDAMVGFPTVETCEVGSISWIDPVVAGQDEPELPAPTVLLTADAPTAAELAPAEEESGHDDAGHAAVTTTAASPDASDDSSSSTAVVAGAVIVVALGLVGAVLIIRRRRTD